MKDIKINPASLLFTLLILSLFLAGCGEPAGVTPPDETLPPADWTQSPGYTWQCWEFNSLDIDPVQGWQLPECSQAGNGDAISPGVPGRENPEPPPDVYPPLEPDKLDGEELEPFINSYGTPELIYAFPPDGEDGDWSWYSMGGPWTRCGYYGGMGDTALVFEIPNSGSSGAGSKHEIRIQFPYYSLRKLGQGGALWEIEVGRNYTYVSGQTYLERVTITDIAGISMSDFTFETHIPGGGSNAEAWYKVTAIFSVNDQPDVEYIKLYALEGVAILIDEVTIETRCVD